LTAARSAAKLDFVADLRSKVGQALDEGRMLALVAQVLVGFLLRATFEPRFEGLGEGQTYLVLGGLFLMLLALGLILAPAAYHQIVERGEDTVELHALATRTLDVALVPFALGLGIDLEVAFGAVLGRGAGIAAGLAAMGTALLLWFGWTLRERRARGAQEVVVAERLRQAAERKTPLETRITHVLTEARTVLPGAQALLGFQFVTILMDEFQKLPAGSKYLHLAALSLVAVAIVFLMLPAAYHRLVEEGEDTERLHSVASVSVIAAMVALALGVAGDLFVVARKVTESDAVALALTAAVLAFYAGLWFGYTLLVRRRRNAPGGGTSGRIVAATA
jgi:hypothetical protein